MATRLEAAKRPRSESPVSDDVEKKVPAALVKQRLTEDAVDPASGVNKPGSSMTCCVCAGIHHPLSVRMVRPYG